MVARRKLGQKPQDKIIEIEIINNVALQTVPANPTTGTEVEMDIAATMVSQIAEIAEIAMSAHTVIINPDRTGATIHAVIISEIEQVIEVITTTVAFLIAPINEETTDLENLATGIHEMVEDKRKFSPITTGFVKSVTMLTSHSEKNVIGAESLKQVTLAEISLLDVKTIKPRLVQTVQTTTIVSSEKQGVNLLTMRTTEALSR